MVATKWLLEQHFGLKKYRKNLTRYSPFWYESNNLKEIKILKRYRTRSWADSRMFTASINIWSLRQNQTDWKSQHINAFFHFLHFVFASDIYLIRQPHINTFYINICLSKLCASNEIIVFFLPIFCMEMLFFPRYLHLIWLSSNNQGNKTLVIIVIFLFWRSVSVNCIMRYLLISK